MSWGERLADVLLRQAGLRPRLLPALDEMTPEQRAIYRMGWEAARQVYAPPLERAERLLADRLQHQVSPWVREARAALGLPDDELSTLRRRVEALEAEAGGMGSGSGERDEVLDMTESDGSYHAHQHSPREDRAECGSHSRRRWYCGQTHPGRHFEARDELIKQGFETLLPLGVRQLPGGLLRIEPLLGPYLLVRFDVTRPGWRRISNTRGMKRVFGATPEMPTPIRDADAEAIRDMVVSTEAPDAQVERGHAVRVVSGPWQGRTGLCLDVWAGVVRALLFLEHGPRDCEVLARWCRRA